MTELRITISNLMTAIGFKTILPRLLLICILIAVGSKAYPIARAVTRSDSLYTEASRKYKAGRQADSMDDLLGMLNLAADPATKVHPEDRAKACLMLGNIYLGYNDHINAAKYYEQGLRFSSDPEMHLKFAYNLSVSYCLMGNEKKAKEHMNRLKEAKVKDRHLQLYDLAVSEATIEKVFGDQMKSITLFKHSLALVDSFSLAPGKYAIGPLSEVAEYYETTDRLDSARFWLTNYERVAINSHYPHAVADSRRGLMRLFIKTGETDKALKYSSLYMSTMDSMVDFKRFINVSSRREREREYATEAHIENLKFIISWQQAAIYAIIALIIVVFGLWIAVKKFRGNMRHLFARNRELAILEDEIKSGESPIASETAKTSETNWHELMHKINEAISDPANYLDPDFSINTLAAICNSNTRYISQAINETTGDNFRAMLNGHRIREARRRLTSDPKFADLTIQSVGESVGFRSSSNFINAFKKVTGMTPSLYQKMMKEKDLQN